MNHFRRNTLIVSAIVAGIFLLRAGYSFATPPFKSAHPRFAKFAVTQDGSKVMLVAFDESKGTGKGYDTLYADTNCDGKLDPSERVSREHIGRNDASFSSFPAVRVKTLFNAKAKCDPKWGTSTETHFGFFYVKVPSKVGTAPTEHFITTASVALNQHNEPFIYNFSIDTNPSHTAQKAPLFNFSGVPVIKADTRPDKARKGCTGIGLNITLGQWNVRGGNQPMTTALTITSADGKKIESHRDDLQNFGFG